jgi:hypothetical protein
MNLEQLIAERDMAAKKANSAISEYNATKHAITKWGIEQIQDALIAKGITPGRSVVRMDVRKIRRERIVIEETECLLNMVARVNPPTLDRGALGPNAASTDMWWSAQICWRNIRKDGTPGATFDRCVIQGDTVADVVSKIEHVRDLETAQ